MMFKFTIGKFASLPSGSISETNKPGSLLCSSSFLTTPKCSEQEDNYGNEIRFSGI